MGQGVASGGNYGGNCCLEKMPPSETARHFRNNSIDAASTKQKCHPSGGIFFGVGGVDGLAWTLQIKCLHFIDH